MSARSDVFFKTKKMVIAAIDAQIKESKENIKTLSRPTDNDNDDFHTYLIGDYQSRIDELERLRHYIRNGMLWNTTPGRRKK